MVSHETILDKPIQPGEIYKMFYSHNGHAVDVVQAVLQQEVVLYCGKLIGTNPELFKSILNIRIALLLRAMDYYLNDISGLGTNVRELAPNEVREFRIFILH